MLLIPDLLCSEKRSVYYGQNINIDGGLSLIWQESLSGIDAKETKNCSIRLKGKYG